MSWKIQPRKRDSSIKLLQVILEATRSGELLWREARRQRSLKKVTPEPKVVANGVPGGATPEPGVAIGVELVPVDENGVPVEIVVAVEEDGVLGVASPALVAAVAAVAAVATVVHIGFVKKT